MKIIENFVDTQYFCGDAHKYLMFKYESIKNYTN